MRRGNRLAIRSVASILTGIMLAGLLLVLPGVWTQPARAQDHRLFASGEAVIEVTPDFAQVVIGVETEAATASSALQQNTRRMSAVVEAIKRAGVAQQDLQTADYNLTPVQVYDENLKRTRLVGYRASNQLSIRVRNLETVGKLIDDAVTAGATNVDGISFSVTDQAAWENRAIEKAIAETQARAKLMAKAAGVSLGQAVTIQASVQPVPVNLSPRGGVLYESAKISTPVESGRIKIRANVQMVFEM